MIAVIAPGGTVKFGPLADPIEGVVIAACLRGTDNVTYEVAWWNGRVREEKWMAADELRDPRGGAHLLKTIGFTEAAP